MRNEIAILSKTCLELVLMQKTKHLRIGRESFFFLNVYFGNSISVKIPTCFRHIIVFRQFYMVLAIKILT